jgi:antitoxin ParD1/3/4
MNILLDAEQVAFVQSQLQDGRFSHAEDVVAAALQLMAEQAIHEQLMQDPAWIAEMRASVQVGIDNVQRGDVVDGETFLAELQQKLEQKKAASL